MKRILKRIVIFLVTGLILLAAMLAAWVFFLFPKFFAAQDAGAQGEEKAIELAEASKNIDYNQDKGLLYFNNELVVIVDISATQEEIQELSEDFEALVDDSMADIGIYKFQFEDAMEYEKLESLLKKVKSKPIVEDAYLNTLTEFDVDTVEADDGFGYKEPEFPNDDWNGASWDVDVPREENWGMEAIDAPGAWGYLDRLNKVKIGLIDSMPNKAHEDLKFSKVNVLSLNEKTGITSINQYTVSPDDHGTHVSGTINAKWNNKTGVSGVMGGKGEMYYSAVFYETKGKLSTRYGTAYSYLLALKNLIDQDVQVINISQNTNRLIGFSASHGNANAVNYLSMQANLTEKGLLRIIAAREAAGKPDFVICVAAGNSNNTYYYPDQKATYGYRTNMTALESLKWAFGWNGEIGNSLALYNNFLNLMDAEAVKSRVIVVGAVGIDTAASTSTQTRYGYANFSNVGSRVDVVAPGVNVYSCEVKGYASYSGTSMAAPHVSGVAGLIFAANPDLSGPEVKDILVATAVGRYYHGGNYSGLVNANNAVVAALKTEKASVDRVLKTETDNGLDLCFVVDTTGSMGDDIENAKNNMENILEHLAAKTTNYRVALIDYRDYPDRSGDSDDYPYRVQLTFTNDNHSITSAINGLDLGDGGDTKETVYAALVAAVKMDWRTDAKKVIIILGDAAPLDPEPVTGLTYDDVLLALFNADISIDYDDSDGRVTDSLDQSMINVFSIGTSASSGAEDFFEDISGSTGGSYASVDDASQVSDAIIDSIEQIEVEEKQKVTADFGESMANQKISLYADTDFLFTIETDEQGQCVIDAMEVDSYRWTSNGIHGSGSMEIEKDKREAEVHSGKTYWFAPVLLLWNQNQVQVWGILLTYLLVCMAVPGILKMVVRPRQKKKCPAAPVAKPVPEKKKTGPVCPHCGCRIGLGDLFCEHCGQDLRPKKAELPKMEKLGKLEELTGEEAPPKPETPTGQDIAQQPEEPPKPAGRLCQNCGFVNKEQAAYCGKCGAKLPEELT